MERQFYFEYNPIEESETQILSIIKTHYPDCDLKVTESGTVYKSKPGERPQQINYTKGELHQAKS